MFCAISGKPPRFPVVSPHSKCIFEKQLIEQYVSDEGKDPITNSPLRVDELIEIAQRPEQSSFADSLNSSTLNTNYSIPNLLSTLQNEWDAIMLENFKLRKRLDDCTKKLSVAFYERDAAKIVAAKALKSRDDIMHEMNQLISQVGTAEESVSIKNEVIPAASTVLLESLSQKSISYMKKTKKVASEFDASSLAPFTFAVQWDVSESLKLHRTTTLCRKFQQSIAFQLQDASEICYLEGPLSHRIATAPFNEKIDYLKSMPRDSCVLFAANGKMGVCDFANDQLEVTESEAVEIIFMENHEEILSDHFLWADQCGNVGLTSVDCKITNTLIQGSQNERFYQAAYHKDGLLLALVSKTAIRIFDLTKPKGPSTDLQVGKEIKVDGEIREVRFSSNGYWMIVYCGDYLMAFDLRKAPGTLAVTPFKLGTAENRTFWDLDVSAKHLALLQQGTSDHHYNLQFFSFQKSKKAWESINDKTFDVDLSNATNQEINYFLMLYTKEGPAAVLQTPGQVILYTTQ